MGGLNIDTPLLAGPAHDVTVIGSGKNQLDAFLSSALVAQNRTVSPDPSPQVGLLLPFRSFQLRQARRADALYRRRGGFRERGGARRAAPTEERYTVNAYHGPEDEFDPKWDWSVVKPDLELQYRLGRMMAISTSWPNWLPGDEFRRIRDESCKAASGGC